MKPARNKAFCWALIAVLLVQWSGLPSIAAAQERSADPEQAAARLEKLFDALEAEARNIPRDTFDPQAIIDTVGTDPEDLFAWVRSNTYLVAYQGLLRGARGVLMDRLGNSLDRAMLLYALIRGAGEQVRLARGKLSDAAAEMLAARARPVPKEGPLPPAQLPSLADMSIGIGPYAQRFGVDAEDLERQIRTMTLALQRLAEESVQRTAEQTEQIAALVEPYRIEVAREEFAVKRRATLSDHWWVQWRDDGEWIDLDPSLPDARPGNAIAERALATYRPETLGDLPEESIHWLTIAVVVEFWKNGEISEHTVLEQRLLPAALIGEPISLRFVPVPPPEDIKVAQDDDPLARLRALALDQHQWLPVLTIGKHHFYKYSFTDNALINDATLPGYVQNVLAGRRLVRGMEEGAEDLGRRVQGMFSGGFGQSQAPESDKDRPARGNHLTGVWFDFTLNLPQGRVQTERRQVVDLLGQAVRASGQEGVQAPELTEGDRLDRAFKLMGSVDILPLVAQPSADFADHVTARGLLASRDMLRRVGFARDPGPEIDPPRFSPELALLWMLALVRGQWGDVGGRLYIDRPNLFAFHKQLRWTEREDRPRGLQAADIVFNDVAPIRLGDVDPFVQRLRQGVFDTNAEAFLMAASGTPLNTSELMARSPVQNIDWIAVTDRGDAAWQKVDLPANVRGRAASDLVTDTLVVLPRKLVDLDGRAGFAWWRIDQRTGQTLGRGELGLGQSAVEWIKILLPGPILLTATVLDHYCPTSGYRWYCHPCFIAGLYLIAMLAGLYSSLVANESASLLTSFFAAGMTVYGGAGLGFGLLPCLDLLPGPKSRSPFK